MPASMQCALRSILLKHLLLAVLLIHLVLPAIAAPGPTIQINASILGMQNEAAVAAQTTGEVFVVWQRRARRFAADGTPLDTHDFSVPQTTSFNRPDVAMNDHGDAVVVWQDNEIYARLYSFEDSVPPSDEFLVNSSTAGPQNFPSVAIDSTGNVVVVYESSSLDTSPIAIGMQRFDATGVPLGAEEVVGITNSGRDLIPQIAMGSADQFAVAWASVTELAGIYVRFYDANGNPSTEPILIESGLWPSLAFSPSDALLVVYSRNFGVQASLFDPAGQQVGGEWVLVDPEEGVLRDGVQVAALDSGEFLLTWQQRTSGANDEDVYSLRLAADGIPVEEPAIVHTMTDGQQKWPDIASTGKDAVIVFSAPDGDQSGIFATCFRPDGCIEVFADDFESGNVSAWSTAIP